MFELKAPYKPRGDQIRAIKEINKNFNKGINKQILLGATGTGKTFTIANIINKLGKKTLVLAPNKTLAGQLYGELKSFFPNDRVEYFISYYDYYQPEAYVASKDLYIEKDSSVNDEIDELRHSATSSLLSNDNVIVVASVSCIYGIGDKDDYINSVIFLRQGDNYGRDNLIKKLTELSYKRNDIDFKRGTFRVRGDIIDIIPINTHSDATKITLFGDEIEKITKFDPLTSKKVENQVFTTIFPATHFVTNPEKLKEATKRIKKELIERVSYFKKEGKLLEAQRIEMRTKHDLDSLIELGYCSGVENYSRHLSLRNEGDTPTTLMDFFGDDYLLIIDESHVTIPQVRGMYAGDRSRKKSLVDFGFRLPSALDNRPLEFHEFKDKLNKVLFLSATPGDYELNNKYPIIEQIIRPTYLLDPKISVRKTIGQIDDLYFEIKKRINKNERVLITTLTIKMSEDLTKYLQEKGLKVAYLHSKIKSLKRIAILQDLRRGKYDCLIGINLLREGLDLPEVSLVAILNADQQGFLRSDRSLIQTIGRAARNINGEVIMYADTITPQMKKAIDETNRRRKVQKEYNEKFNFKPKTIEKEIRSNITILDISNNLLDNKTNEVKIKGKKLLAEINKVRELMLDAAKNYNFEEAAELRDILFELKLTYEGENK